MRDAREGARGGDCLCAGCNGESRYESKNAEAMIAAQKSS